MVIFYDLTDTSKLLEASLLMLVVGVEGVVFGIMLALAIKNILALGVY